MADGVTYQTSTTATPPDATVVATDDTGATGHVQLFKLAYSANGSATLPGGKMRIVHPYAGSGRAFQDPTHRRFINETTWHYFSREWRESQRLDHYPITSDFEIVVMSGMLVPDHITARTQEFQDFARAHYWNVLGDLYVELKARK